MKILITLFLLLILSQHCFSQSSDVNTIVTDYENRIRLNGGVISASDLQAVNTFVRAAKTNNYWDKIIDLAPLAGQDLNAALVKLKFPVPGTSLIANNGFQPSDYTPTSGLKLNRSCFLNSNTNLSKLNLQGLFGYSMWIEDKGWGWIGLPNSASPYSTLAVAPSSVNAYIGSASNYAVVGGGVPSSREGFFHVIKQSLNTAKVFVDGRQVGITSNTPTTTELRDAAIQVFRDASDIGKGQFYCIDNGMLSNEQAVLFFNDVKRLLQDLGRRIAPPVFSAHGLYTQTQLVSITESPTNSLMAGATIHYTLDGTTPTVLSPIYNAPLAINKTTRLRAIAVKNDRVSEQTDKWISIVPQGFTSTKYYTAHVMVNLLAFTDNMDEWLKQMKASGYNLIWAHLDDYSGNYISTLRKLMDASARVGGIPVMPGPSWWVEPASVSQMYTDTWNHPALFTIGGKKVYTGWDYQMDNQSQLDNLLAAQNISTDDYYLWVHSRYPISYNDGATWLGENMTTSGYLSWFGTSDARSLEGVHHLYDTRPQIDGLINFAVDQGNKYSIIKTNRYITQSSVPRGKFSMAGVSSFYASVSFSDFGFNGAAEIWDSLLVAPAHSRPTAMSDITANDYAELSYISPLVIPAVNGMSFVPPLNAGFNLGDNVRYPIADHSGIQKFLRPWVEAYKNNLPAPTFQEDRMFSHYYLHPSTATPNPVLPTEFSNYAHLNQSWWNKTVYATGHIEVGGGNQVYGIKTRFETDKIKMAAHLTAPAQLKINNTLSELKPAGAAYFEIDRDAFRGTPTFSIVRNGVEVKTGKGLQPITDNVFPGGWNFLSTEIDPQVDSASIKFNGKVFLQGAYNAGTGRMNNALNMLGILQAKAATQPYNKTPTSYTGTESVNATFFANHQNIVDWVLLELRDSATNSTLTRKALFVNTDGVLVDLDGSTTQIGIPGIARGKYQVAIRHRNHLGIKSKTTLDFNGGSAAYDFTTSASSSFSNQSYSSTVQIGSIWAMRAGNANVNNNVKFNGPDNDQNQIQNSGLEGSISSVLMNMYTTSDINMDGSIRTNGPNNDQNFLLNMILNGMLGNIIYEQL
ncbi:hypothetical protein EXU57_20745 [Segetibacter sp. 3557_3]|nr:endo-1,3-alpha-glucanase family glycosylhydrolase [Segetibacter sp. 3557_3]TDH20826.1 hypothetical protein EXU57_20745 [Segetibacter sp. 3557_3]